MKYFLILIFFFLTITAQALTILSSNSTTTPLASSATFTGTAEKLAADSWLDAAFFSTMKTESVLISILTDQDGILYMEQSPDGTNWDSSLTYAIHANLNEVHRLTVTRQYFRIRITNTSASSQTFLRAQSLAGESENLAAPTNLTLSQDADALSVRIFTEALDITQGKRTGYIVVHKFGNNLDVDTATVPEDIWAGSGVYTGFPTGSAELVEVFSSDAADTSAGTGCQTLKIFGLDSSKALQEETISLAGATEVESANTYSRVFRAVCITVGSGGINAGIITARHTTTTANVFAMIQAGRGQTTVAAYTIPVGYTGHMFQYTATMRDSGANRAGMVFWIREENKSVRLIRDFEIATDSAPPVSKPYGGLVLQPKTDIACRAVSVVNNNGIISCLFDIILIKN